MNENHKAADDTTLQRPIGLGKQPPSGPHDLVPAQDIGGLPVVQTATKPVPRRLWWLRGALALAILAGGGGAAYYGWQRLHPPLPPGIAFGNGRLEADEINIDTKYAGRISEMLADNKEDSPDQALMDAAKGPEVQKLLAKLDQRQRKILEMRFGLDGYQGPPRTFKQIGQVIGLTRERVRQLEKEALASLRKAIE